MRGVAVASSLPGPEALVGCWRPAAGILQRMLFRPETRNEPLRAATLAVGPGAGSAPRVPWVAVVAAMAAGAVVASGLLVVAAARAEFAGTTVPARADWWPGVAALAAGGSFGWAAARRPLLVALVMALGCAAVAALALLGAELGSWWSLAMFCGVLGASTGLQDLVRCRAGGRFGWALAGLAAATAAGLALAWPWLRTIAELPSVVVAIGITALAGAFAATGSGREGHSASRRGRGFLLAAGVATLGFAAPLALWNDPSSPALVTFVALAAASLVAVFAATPWLGLVLLAGAPWLVAAAAGDVAVDPGQWRLLGAQGAAQARYERRSQEQQLWSGGCLVDAEGPDRAQAPLVATVLTAFAAPGDRVLLLGVGTGRLPAALAPAAFEVDAVDFRTDAWPLLPRLAGDGPVPQPAAAPVGGWRRRTGGLARALAELPAASRQAIVVAEPLHAGSGWQTQVATQVELRRVVGGGLVVQPFAFDRTAPAMLAHLLDAAGVAHPWNGVFAVGDCGLLVSAGAQPRWPESDAFDRWPATARWLAHATHIGSALDLQLAWLGTVGPGVALAANESGSADAATRSADRHAVVAVLHRGLLPPPTLPPQHAASVLGRWIALQGELRNFAAAARAAADTPTAAASVQMSARRFLPIGAPTAWVQASLGLVGEDGVALRGPALASLCAQALDPTFFAAPLPPLFRGLPQPVDPTGALEDLASLPTGARLVDACSGDQALAVALRARFPSRCAVALVAELAERPLLAAAAQALREVADPFVLAEAGRVLAARGAVRELLGLWRGDLAMPRALRSLQGGAPADRQVLVEALAGRRDPTALAVLADSLVDADLHLRRVAAVALQRTAGERIPYDPEWPQSRLLVAAEQVRNLHNRAP